MGARAGQGVRLVLFGAPGVGKGTQAQALEARLAARHVSTGDMLRQAIRAGTPQGLRAREIVARGDLVPDDLISEMIGEVLRSEEARDGFILDGFPRTLGQAEYLDRALEDLGRSLDVVVNLEVPEAEIAERLGGRRICPACGATYHVRLKPPRVGGRCDACGTGLAERADDSAEVVRERLSVYATRTAPVLDYYRSRGLLRDVDGRGRPEEVSERVEGVVAALKR